MLNLIVAYETSRGIGINNKLPWHISNDLKRFKELTKDHAVLMGRKTYESIGNPLPNRENIILTRDRGFRADNCYIITNLAQLDVYMSMNPDNDVWVIGGSEIYKLLLPYVDRLYITNIHASFDCDTYFPKFETDEWTMIEEYHNDVKPFAYTFEVYERLTNDR